jgi:HEAT repeat protein
MLDRYPKMAGNETVQVSMLSVMGKLGDVHAVSLLKKEFDSSNPVIRQAAFRAMTDWPGSDFIDTMKALAAEKNSDEKNRILAFRAYIRMLDDSVTQANRKNSIDALIAAYPMAPRVEEKKIVIGAIGHFDDIATLTFLQTLMTNPDLKAEVEVSLIQICEKLLPQNPSAVKPVLESLKNTSSNESIKKKAGELLALN